MKHIFLPVSKMKDKENKTKWTQFPSTEELKKLKDSLRFDQEIYDFIAQRFFNQYSNIMKKIKTKS